jgi:hypothetical protein
MQSTPTSVVLPDASSSTSCWRLAAARKGAVSLKALFASMVVALTVTPALCAMLLTGEETKESLAMLRT